MMRQDRFTEQAQEVLAASQELVRKERHAQWDVEHVLLALVHHPGGLAHQILEQLKVDPEEVSKAGAAGLERTPKLACAHPAPLPNRQGDDLPRPGPDPRRGPRR